MSSILFQGKLYNDDRMFVLYITKGRADAERDGVVEATIYHESPPLDCKWCLVTYLNTERYPAVDVDEFETLDEARAYLQRVEPTVPLISLGGAPPSTPLAYEEFVAWKRRNGMKEY